MLCTSFVPMSFRIISVYYFFNHKFRCIWDPSTCRALYCSFIMTCSYIIHHFLSSFPMQKADLPRLKNRKVVGSDNSALHDIWNTGTHNPGEDHSHLHQDFPPVEPKDNDTQNNASKLPTQERPNSSAQNPAQVDITDHAPGPASYLPLDLLHLAKNQPCWEHFDLGMLQKWDAANTMYCTPPGWPAGGSTELLSPRYSPFQNHTFQVASEWSKPNQSWLRCRVITQPLLPPATAPHTFCDGQNLVLRPADMQSARCLASRPGYLCGEPVIHWSFPQGVLTGNCAIADAFRPTSFPRDHLRDTFKGFSSANAAAVAEAKDIFAPVVLLMAREKSEYANLFHSMTDVLNAYTALVLLGLVDGRTGARVGAEQVQVLLLDEAKGPFDSFYFERILSPHFPVQRISSLKKDHPNQALLLRRAVFVPPGYSNYLLASVLDEGRCHSHVQHLYAFRNFMNSHLPPLSLPSTREIRVVFVSRRKYNLNGALRQYLQRQIVNEDEIVDTLRRQYPTAEISTSDGKRETVRVRVERIDFAQFPLDQQVDTVRQTDIMIGMHGAALTHTLFLQPGSVLFELWPSTTGIWRCFEHIAPMSGVHYVRWSNRHRDKFRKDSSGDYTTVTVSELLPLFDKALNLVRDARKGQDLDQIDLSPPHHEY